MDAAKRIGSAVIGLLLLYQLSLLKYVLFVVLILVFIAMAVGVYNKNTNRMCKSKKMLHGKTVLVVGGTSGIGLEMSKDMAHRGAKVIIAGPFEDEGQNAKKHVKESSKSNKVSFKLLDLSSLAMTRQFAADILKDEDRVDIMINSAGTGAFSETADGMNLIMQVNYFGQLLLQLLLVPLLKKSGSALEPSRIVNISSSQHRIGHIDYENWNNGKHFSAVQMYSNSKLCMTISTLTLSSLLKGSNVIVNMLDPGQVGGTKIHNNIWYGNILSSLYSICFKNTWEGAQTALYVALSDKAGKVTGQYYRNCLLSSPAQAVLSKYNPDILWDKTMKLVKLKEEEWNYDLP